MAEALGFVNELRPALTLWKSILKPDRVDSFVCTSLECAKKTGDDAYILSFCKQLRTAGVHNPYTTELEVVTQEKYRLFDEAIEVMQAYLSATPKDDLARVFRVRLAILGMRLGRTELIEKDIANLPPVETAPVKIAAAVAYILRNGPSPKQGVHYAYELVRRHYDDALARQAYVGTIGVGDDLSELFPKPATVAPGCAVKYKADDTGEEKWVIIEDADDPSFEREEISPNHVWAVEMAGQSVGGKFHLRRDPVQNRMATIQGIISKFVYRKLEIINNWEDRFPDQFFVRKYTFPTKEDGSPDISPILKVIDLKEQHQEEMHALYRDNPISATTFARFSGAGLLKSLSQIASQGTLATFLGKIRTLVTWKTGRSLVSRAGFLAFAQPIAIRTVGHQRVRQHVWPQSAACH
ncbi:MAG: hypothetical protein FJ271_15725 [Planctomycetes bacterium]|nr:hypothetical protein [Planctomycetota bacterium]